MKKCIILANGRPPENRAFEFLKSKGFGFFICADGGANTAKNMGLTPDIIIGDLDSVEDATITHFKNVAKIIKVKRQDDTDVEKALKYAVKKGFTEAVLLGGTGDRLDHSFGNLGIVLKFYGQIKIFLISEQSVLTAHEKKVNIDTIKGESISLYGFDKKTKITSSGLKYKLTDEALPFGIRESTSNVANSTMVSLKIKKGKIFLMRNFSLMMENDLF